MTTNALPKPSRSADVASSPVRQLAVTALAVAAGLLATGCAHHTATEPDVVYVNGKIVTVDKNFSIAQAVAIKNGAFVAVGSDERIRRLLAPRTKVVDLQGRTAVPGLMDAHTHMDGAGTVETTAQVIKARTVAEAQAIIGDFIRTKTIPAGQWVQSSRWHPPSQLKEQRYLTREELDAVAPDHPVYVQTVGHFAMANSKALAAAGITRDTPDPVGGKIHRDASGEPNGVVESAALQLVEKVIPSPTFEQRVAQNIAGQRVYNRSGITSTVVAGLNEDQIKAYYAVAERGQSTVRAGMFWRFPVDAVQAFEAKLKSAPFKDGQGDDWARLAGIKLVSDGGMTLKSAYIRGSYAHEPGNHGMVAVDPDTYVRMVRVANRNGWRVHTHAVGDAAVDLTLKAYASADTDSSIAGRRFSVVHGSLVAADQIETARSLDVRIDAQNAFMWDKAGTVERYMGPLLAHRAVPTRRLLDVLGMERTSAGTDNEVNLLNPFIGMYLMVTRKDPRGIVYGADQKISREEALRLYTNAGPYLTFEEKRKGSIEVGKLADMVVLSADYLSVPEEKIKDIVAIETIVGGRPVYRAAP
ncbi:amidohydrolase [Variovorax sp. CCNWLW225]|jgi:predicted amidohydrolase YtcJ|uniref:amidohydrolase n=1 Tax=Variovorax sp. CCNWLW225 TaxID=3127462 RepID=UPI0030785303